MRIGGIASGMDTEQMVSELMKVERMRVDRLFQQEQRLKWRQEAYNNINRQMANFILDSKKAFGLTTTTSSGVMLSSSVNNLNWVKKATSSNESYVKVTASANAMAGTHTVKVKELAEVARVSSGKLLKYDEVTGELSKNSVLDEGLKFKENGSFTIKTATGEKTFDIGEDSIKNINDLVKEINNATVIDENGKTVSLGLRAAFDKGLGQLMISTKDTGADQNINITTTIGGIFAGDAIEKTGKDAEIEFNGETVTKSTNNFSVYGINLQLQSKQVEEAEPITLHVDSDVDSMFDKIKSFVDEYNKIIDDINGQLGQKYYRDFPPLTSEQKEAMTEKDIELWEEKSKSGLIKNDGNLTRMLQTMRTQLYEKVEGVNGSYNHITQIGITTGRYQDGGKLVIDEEKLKNAINDDPEGVMDLLFKVPDGSVADEEKFQNTGLVQRIYDTMVDGMKEIITKSGPGEDAALLRNVRSNILIDFVTKQSSISLLDKDLSNISNRIAREESILLKREDSYWQRFTAMEKAMASMQQQSMWLMSQMGLQ